MHKSKLYEPRYHSKENFMLDKYDFGLFFRILNRSEVRAV